EMERVEQETIADFKTDPKKDTSVSPHLRVLAQEELHRGNPLGYPPKGVPQQEPPFDRPLLITPEEVRVSTHEYRQAIAKGFMDQGAMALALERLFKPSVEGVDDRGQHQLFL